MKLLAVDSNSILNRAFYGIKALTTKSGEYTNGIVGFLNILQRLLEQTKPDAVACAFDLRAPTFRHKLYDGYKGKRKGMPEELAGQLEPLKALITALGYKIVSLEGYEADDILGTLSRACSAQGGHCYIATGDRDSLQLVNENVSVILATTKMNQPLSTLYTPEAIMEKYGVAPQQLIEVKALMGDASDNIPGVAGIGEKGALELISRFGTIEEIYSNLQSIDLKPAMRKKLEAGHDSAMLSHTLGKIACDAPIETSLDAYRPAKRDDAAAARIFARLEMFKIAQKWDVDLSAAGTQTLDAAEHDAPAALTLEAYGSLPESARGDLLADWYDGDPICAFVCENRLFTGGRELLERLRPNFSQVRVFSSKSVYRDGFERGLQTPPAAFDAELAAYLLSPSAADYEIADLAAQYGAPARPLAVLRDGAAVDTGVADAAQNAAKLETDTTSQPTLFGEDTPARAPLWERLLSRACYLTPLLDDLSGQLERQQQQTLLHDIEMPLARVLASMESLGFRLDTTALNEYGLKLAEQVRLREKAVYTLAGHEFKINSPKQLGQVLFEEMGLPAKRKTKTGYSTNADVLDTLRGLHPIVDEILEYRKMTKLKSTYVDGLLKVVGRDGRVRTTFQQTQTRTGRISSVEPNLQNIPVRTPEGATLRRFFLPRSGWRLLDADYSQIELRVLAHIAGDKAMIEAFRSGADIHTATAAQVFGMPIDMVTPQMRSRAKAVNFGIVYGIGAFSLAQDIGVSVAEADSYIKGYLQTYSGVRRYMEDTIEKAKRDGYVTTLFGRRRYLPELAAANKNTRSFGERVARNMPIQGTAADIIKIAMVRVYERLEREKLAARLILQVHDELLVEAPPEEVQAASAILREEMENAIKLDVPLLADTHEGSNWLEAK